MKCQAEPSKRRNGNSRKRPRKDEKENGIFSCWCCGEEHLKEDYPRKKKKKEENNSYEP